MLILYSILKAYSLRTKSSAIPIPSIRPDVSLILRVPIPVGVTPYIHDYRAGPAVGRIHSLPGGGEKR